MMFSVCCASFIFIMTSSLWKMPISGTHTVVGALLGAGLYGDGFSNLNWQKLGKIVASWFISPVLSAAVAFMLMSIVSIFTMNTSTKNFKTRLINLQFIVGFAAVIIAFILYFLLGLEGDIKVVAPILSICSFILGVIMCRLVLLISLLNSCKVVHSKCEILQQVLSAIFLPFSFRYIEVMTLQIELVNDDVD